MKNLTFLAVLVFLVACQPKSQNEEQAETAVYSYSAPQHHSSSLTKLLDAHGGYEQWTKMKLLSYTKGEESTVANLQNRKIQLESPTKTIGFDGENVWVTPDSVDASQARFYHNLYFYFYAMPFVVGDPGAFYADVEARELQGKTYKGIKVSYDENIGDAPDDNYIIWVDPETNKMEWLMYTVTYRSGESNAEYKLIKYHQWADFNGVMLPTTIQWYEYKDDVVGNLRNEVLFENIQITENLPDSSLFEIPKGSQIAPR